MLKREEAFLRNGEEEDTFLSDMENKANEKVIEDASTPYRFIWWNCMAKTFTTFCEGEISWVMYESNEDAEAYLTALRTFFKNDRIGRT